jgi:hypothetical protein
MVRTEQRNPERSGFLGVVGSEVFLVLRR